MLGDKDHKTGDVNVYVNGGDNQPGCEEKEDKGIHNYKSVVKKVMRISQCTYILHEYDTSQPCAVTLTRGDCMTSHTQGK